MAQAEHAITAIPASVIGAKLPNILVPTAHAGLATALAGMPPRPIPLDTRAIDLEERADHLDDPPQSVPCRLELRHLRTALSDLSSDITGTIQQTADEIAGRFA